MKRLLFLSLFQLIFCPAMFAQLGDFHLDAYAKDSQYRSYETAPANPSLKGGPIKNLFIGKNYRKEWRQPVRVPVLDLMSDLGGIKPKEEGGGRQTRSLEIKDANGYKWVLRSVRKYPVNVVIPALRGTIVEKIVADGISASYPYAVLSVGTMAKSAGIPYLPNTLVFIPNHPYLGEFREKFRNTLSFLERRTIDTTQKDEKTYNTHEVVPKLFQSGKNQVDQLKVLRARLLDNFIMDFDRHEDQWEWVKKDSGDRTFYYPVAKDRDQAFFRTTGLLPKVARIFQPTLGQLQGLRAKAANIRTFNFVAKDFDRSFLNQLDEKTWNRELDAFLSSVNDTVIEDALRRQPDEIEKFRLPRIINTLKEKRHYFKEDMLAYYRFLSRIVSITGTNEQEQFTISLHDDGTTMVQVATLDSNGKAMPVTYNRSFFPDITKELRIYGLEGDDRFVIRGGQNQMKIRLIGGPGNDSFINESNGGSAKVYDLSVEDNTVVGGGLKNKFSDDPLVNEYRRLDARYNTGVPGLGLEVTREGGLFLGLTYRLTTHGFRKEPYASTHYFYLTRALYSSSWHAKYNADIIGIGKKTDLLFRSEATLPTVRTYFFGLGNNTVYNKRLGWEYYVTRYQLVDVSMQARYSPNSWLQFRAGPVVQYLKMEADRNKGNFASVVIAQSPAQAPLYDGLWYGGAEIRAEVNRRNHPNFTTRGIHTNLYARMIRGLSQNSGDFEQLGGNVAFFTDLLWKRIIVLATNFGADRNYGNFAFPQAQYLGFRQNLRGFRFQRFAGDTRAYNNSEVRINLGVRNFYFFKGLVGLIGFHDVGRVWINGEDSDTWHRGYGYGVWVAPFNKAALLFTLASSREEKDWLQFSFGFQF